MRIQVLIALFLGIASSAPASAEVEWSCGSWEADPSGKCEEIRVCTRTICDSIEDLSTCKTETRTECANPVSPVPDASSAP